MNLPWLASLIVGVVRVPWTFTGHANHVAQSPRWATAAARPPCSAAWARKDRQLGLRALACAYLLIGSCVCSACCESAILRECLLLGAEFGIGVVDGALSNET